MEQVNSPSHYNLYPVEVITMMEKVFGKTALLHFCLLSAFKYRMRANQKGDPDIDFKKEAFYLNKAKELRSQEDKLPLPYGK